MFEGIDIYKSLPKLTKAVNVAFLLLDSLY